MTIQQKLISVIETYLSSTASDRHLGSTKANITRLASKLGEEIGAEAARKTIVDLLPKTAFPFPVGNRVEWLRSRVWVAFRS